jgi:hypothetical protein
MANSTIVYKSPFHVYECAISGNIPTETEIANFISGFSSLEGGMCINFKNSGSIKSSLFYTAVSKLYGQGILISYYGSNYYKVRNNNGSITMTAF